MSHWQAKPVFNGQVTNYSRYDSSQVFSGCIRTRWTGKVGACDVYSSVQLISVTWFQSRDSELVFPENEIAHHFPVRFYHDIKSPKCRLFFIQVCTIAGDGRMKNRTRKSTPCSITQHIEKRSVLFIKI